MTLSSTISGARLFDHRARAAFVVAAITLAACGLGFRSAVGYFNVHLRKERVELREHLSSLPRTLGPWEAVGDDLVLDVAQVEELGTDRYLNRAYARNDRGADGVISVHIAYYTGMIDAVPHIPDRCYEGAGWKPLSPPSNHEMTLAIDGMRPDPDHVSLDLDEPYLQVNVTHPLTGAVDVVHLPFGDLKLRTTCFALPDHPDRVRFAGYLFIANNHLTVSPAYIRTMAFRPSQKYAYYVKIQLEMTRRSRDDASRYVEAASDLLGRIVPHLMRCLPDWAEVEAALEHDPAHPPTDSRS